MQKINSNKWNEITSNRDMSNSIVLEKIKFNDYNLLIDEKNSIIYYSIVDLNNKYNPSVEYYFNNDNLKIAVNKEIVDEKSNDYKIMIYNDNVYHIYNLVITSFPIMNIKYQGNDTKKILAAIEFFDNNENSPRKLLKSDVKLKIIKENREYEISLIKESIGHNIRENDVSIFGMEKHNAYRLIKVDSKIENGNYVQLFVNNRYVGIYKLELKHERSIKNG